MATINSVLDGWRENLASILEYYANLPYRYGDVRNILVIDQERNHFMLIQEGWEDYRRVYGTIVHAEIRDNKIWIHYDGIEDGITDELVANGVPKDHIVLAFHPPQIRQHTGYALA